MRTKQEKLPISLPVICAAVLLLMVMVTTHMTAGLYARYTVTASSEDSARVAAFVFEKADADSSQTMHLELSEINSPGDSAEYSFTVSNNRNGRTCEVDLQYQVKAELFGNLPLTCSLTSESGTFEAGVPKTAAYTMTVTWPEEDNDPMYANGLALAECVLTVTAEQID